MNTILNDVKSFMKNTRFSLDEDDGNVLIYSTRENGDMEHDRAGEEDILRARQIRQELIKHIPLIKVSVHTCDEWTFLQIEV